MNFLFGKKPASAQAFAVTLENGRDVANREMQKLKYNREYQNEPVFDIAVRVEPANEAPFESIMKAGLTKTYVLITGVRVQVKYDPAKKQQVTIDDEVPAILARNPQLVKKE
jgi:hypothetical protein